MGVEFDAGHIFMSILACLFVFFCSVDSASLHNLVNGTDLMHNLFIVYFVNFIYNLYMFRTSPGPSSGGTTVFVRHLVLVSLKQMDSLKLQKHIS